MNKGFTSPPEFGAAAPEMLSQSKKREPLALLDNNKRPAKRAKTEEVKGGEEGGEVGWEDDFVLGDMSPEDWEEKKKAAKETVAAAIAARMEDWKEARRVRRKGDRHRREGKTN
ncbi:hypothetical protein BP6252_09939 [Coleophoma cylindrospora]|uniref:Uncharacterized protein n=1 Tax=Coleophoma cylindrospora TaxID=1849047 RepID=A0A3D8QXN6_9HELO|nr:hypothetical protein BP6252_09939 [Coleophoma cylindrospora]